MRHEDAPQPSESHEATTVANALYGYVIVGVRLFCTALPSLEYENKKSHMENDL